MLFRLAAFSLLFFHAAGSGQILRRSGRSFQVAGNFPITGVQAFLTLPPPVFMATSVHVNPSNQIGLVRYADAVAPPIILDGLQALLTHPDWLPGYDIVWDCRDISKLVIGHDEIEHLLAALRDLRPLIGDGRSAIVVSREVDHLFARLMLFKMSDRPNERRVFQTVGAAMRWLTASDDALKTEQVVLLQQWIQQQA